MTETDLTIDAKNIELVIGGRAILNKLTCRFPGTGLTGLVGRNGSGKSTLMRILARQLRPTGGEVRFGGTSMSDLSSQAFAQQVAYMPQNIPPAPGMTVRELVSLGRYPWHGALGRFGPNDTAAVDRALQTTGTTEFADRILDSLSGGERQLCWLAMLIAQDARMLLLDEPTSALDLGHQHAMLRLLSEITQKRNVGAVIILHDVNLAAQYCNQIVALKNGQRAAAGSPGDIMDPDILRDVFDIPMLVASHPGTNLPYSYADTENVSH